MSKNPIINIITLGFPWQTMDPFLFCVHHADVYPAGNDVLGPAVSLEGRMIGQDFTLKDGWRMYHGEKVPGFPSHPHTGFETVTVTREGFVDHTDSLGAAGRFGNGDVQWMTAGKGVQHAEMFPLINRDKTNPLEFFQIWLNLPKAKKSVEPYFGMLWGETVPEIKLKDENGKEIILRVVAGELMGKTPPAPPPNSWAADPEHEVAIWTIKMEAGAKWTLPPAQRRVNRTLYFFKGSTVNVSGMDVTPNQGIILKPNHEVILEIGDQAGDFLFLQGVPIGEPVVQNGPFVGNTTADIQEVMGEYQRTQFGGWPWPSSEHVHPREKGRFAKYADGHLEVK